MRKTAGALVLVAMAALGQLTPPPKIAGPAGPAKELATGELRRMDPGFSRWIWRITIVGTEAEWNQALIGWPRKILRSIPIAFCRRGTGELFFRATDGMIPTRRIIHHETGHAVWTGALGRKDRAMVFRIFDQALAGSRPFPTKYSQRNEEEFFAESFAIYLATGTIPEAPEIARILDKMRTF